MAALSEFLSHIYTMATVSLTLLFLEVVILIRSLTGKRCSVQKPLISTTQYLQLIEQDNPTISYSKTSPSKPESGECSVCLSEFEEGEEVRNLQCNHTFHKNCLDKWLHLYLATCPLCRKRVLPEEVTANYHRLGNEIEYDGSDEELIFFLSALHGNSMHRFF